MKFIVLAIGFLLSIALSLYLGYREGLQDGFTYTEKVNGVDHATGFLRSANEQAFQGFAWYEKLNGVSTLEEVHQLAQEEREYSLYNIEAFRVQAQRIRDANINYPLLEIYEPKINEMEVKLSE